jgi:hypothetical protein
MLRQVAMFPKCCSQKICRGSEVFHARLREERSDVATSFLPFRGVKNWIATRLKRSQ